MNKHSFPPALLPLLARYAVNPKHKVYALRGVCIEANAEYVTLVASDLHRLSVVRCTSQPDLVEGIGDTWNEMLQQGRGDYQDIIVSAEDIRRISATDKVAKAPAEFEFRTAGHVSINGRDCMGHAVLAGRDLYGMHTAYPGWRRIFTNHEDAKDARKELHAPLIGMDARYLADAATVAEKVITVAMGRGGRKFAKHARLTVTGAEEPVCIEHWGAWRRHEDGSAGFGVSVRTLVMPQRLTSVPTNVREAA